MGNYKHNFHIVDPSPWPFVASLSAFTLATGGALYFHKFARGGFVLLLGFIAVLSVMYVWWRDICREAQIGYHTKVVQQGLRLGVILFIVSEVLFFFAFFWAYFHSSMAPTLEIGAVWPPKGICVFNPWEVPLLNTFILLLSGATVTWAHHALLARDYDASVEGLICTVFLGIFFTFLQVLEYKEALFTIADGIYGSTFFMATGFHGIHVMVGTIFLFICLIRLINYHFTDKEHLGFEAAAWYWHFVDVVWLFLFVTVYWWGGLPTVIDLNKFY